MTRSSQLLALVSPFKHGLIPVRLLGDMLFPNDTLVLLQNELAFEAKTRRLVAFKYVENGEVFVDRYNPSVLLTPIDVVIYAIRYFHHPSVKAQIDEMVGPLDSWRDIKAAMELMR